MMKIFFFLFMFMVMMYYNNMLMFYYNLCFSISLMFLFMYMNKIDLFIMMSYYFSMDYYSFMLNLMSLWIVGLMLMTLVKGDKLKMMIFLMILVIMLFSFSSMNLMIFYFFFELSLIPMFILVVYWGGNFERLSAAFYMLMYTLLISLPLLLYIFWLMNLEGSLSMYLLEENKVSLNFMDYLFFLGAFFIKMPIYLFHLWLPKAHVEAPVYGSMILAAVLLKLGSYGMIRLLLILMKESLKYNYMILALSMIGGIVVSLICLVQVDMKSLVAYSSVVHMNFMICSMMTMYKVGFISAYLMMIGHGLCSSGMFYIVTMFYSRSMSRLMFLNKGMVSLMSIVMMLWFYLCCSNFSFPLSLNFLSEIMMIMVMLSWEVKLMLMIMMISLFSSAYSLYLFSYIFHGDMNVMEVWSEGLFKEFIVLILHCLPLLMYLINMIMFM